MTPPNTLPREYRSHFAQYMKWLTLLILLFVKQATSQAGGDPFSFFQPSITITPSERALLDQGYPFARVLQAKGLEIGVVAAIPVRIDGDRLVAWEQQIEAFKKSPHVLAIGRFSSPPRLEDLDGLELDSSDVAAIRSCHPHSCELKLSSDEMARLQSAAAQAKGDPNEAVQQTFRQIVLNRAEQYLANGHTPPNEDHHEPVQPSSRFGILLDHMPFLSDRLPQLAENLRVHPMNADLEDDAFIYWSKEHLARKAIISITHITILRNHDAGLPDVLIIGRDIFSTHYVNASLSVMALMRGETQEANYLVYVNRTEVDVLHGMAGGMIRRSIQNHLKKAADILADLRGRLESGDPPGTRK